MPKSEIIQMMGRAGRPGLDTHGVAVVMTSYEDRYLLPFLSPSQSTFDASSIPQFRHNSFLFAVSLFMYSEDFTITSH